MFCILCYISKMKQNVAKNTDRTLSGTPKQTSLRNLELFWQSSILAKNLKRPFSTKPFNQ